MLTVRDRLYLCLAVTLFALAPVVGRSADAPTKDEVVAQVKKAVAFYKANGREKTLAEMNNKDGQFAKGEDYVDVHDTHGVCVAHPVSPGIVGLNRMDQADPAGKKWISDIVQETRAGKHNGWITYMRKNPVSGKIEHKLAYWELSDDLIFKAGTYEE
ncbi:MAG TPA: cache domain-containing protein [Steroidobacteraceae bacterium]|nr:cache domain-containing protein [Steroidobacteraceae bacterium]